MKSATLSIAKTKIVIDPAIALALGITEAIILQQLHFYLTLVANKKSHQFGGKTWIWNTYKEWQDSLPFFTERKISDTFRRLENSGIVISCRKGYNPTKYYSLNYKVLVEAIRNSEKAIQYLEAAGCSISDQLSSFFDVSELEKTTSTSDNCTEDHSKTEVAFQRQESQIITEFPEGVI